MKIVTIIGARPQFIKAVALSKAFQAEHIQEVIVHTGQHYDANMSEIFFKELHIPKPSFELNINNMEPYAQLGSMINAIGKILENEKPDYVLVYGDTTSTLAGALAGNKLNFPLIHVEAGMRSFDLDMPEEVNRILTDKIANHLFCPSETAVENLKKEQINENKQKVHNVGDIMMDTLRIFSEHVAHKEAEILSKLQLKPKSYVLATVHRQSNTDNLSALKTILDAFVASKQHIVFVMHPRTQNVLKKNNLLETYKKQLAILDPVSYIDMIGLMKNAKKIITDSGGMQKEASYLGVPCITLRESTEWTETVDAGHNILVGTDKKKIIEALAKFNPEIQNRALYGDGYSAEKIVQILKEEHEKK